MDRRSSKRRFARGRATVWLKVTDGLQPSRQHLTDRGKVTASLAWVHKRMVTGVVQKRDQVTIDFLLVEATALRNHGGQACSDSALHTAYFGQRAAQKPGK